MSDDGNSPFVQQILDGWERQDREEEEGRIERKLRRAKSAKQQLPDAVAYEHFLAYSPEHKYIFRPTGTLWPATTVNARLPWIGGVKPATILDRDSSVEQMTWAPGEPKLIRHKLVVQGGWIDHPNATVFNLYQPPVLQPGNANNAGPWVDHVRKVYPDNHLDIIRWFACRVQRPDIKINHALLLGGEPGIGKDTLLWPFINAIGPWNCESVSPVQVLGRFNGHLKSVGLIINEARDLGELNRPAFFEHLKGIIAAPPNALKIDEKNRQEYYIPNLTGVIITTNHKTSGIYLSAEDRRHLVAWSPLDANTPGQTYFNQIWEWYDNGGLNDIAAYLLDFDLSDFRPKAPPPKTPAFWEIVNASRQIECAQLEDAINNLGNPDIITISDIASHPLTDPELSIALRDRKNRRQTSHWFELADYVAVNNPNNKQGVWRLNGKPQVVYGKKNMPLNELYRMISKKVP